MNLDVKVLYRDDLEIIDPESQDYYQYMVAFLGQAKCESAGAINNMSNSFNSRGLLLPDPDLTHFSTSRKWMPGHIRHLIKVAKPERSFSDTELITILREMDPAKSKDKFLRYLHEYLQSKLANKRDVRIIQNACSTLSKGNIPLPAIEGVTQWSVPVVRELADMCFEKFGGIQPDTVITPPVDKKVPIPSPEHKNEFDQWFLKKLKSNQYNFDTFSAKLKESGRIVTISPIEGISFHDVPEKADWLLYYVYHHGFNRKEIDDNAFTNTLYQMLERIKSREKHLELYNSLIYIASTWSGLRSLAYIESLKRHNIRLPDDLINHTLKGRLIEMHQRAKALQESGWISADIDLTRSKAKVRTSKP